MTDTRKEQILKMMRNFGICNDEHLSALGIWPREVIELQQAKVLQRDHMRRIHIVGDPPYGD